MLCSAMTKRQYLLIDFAILLLGITLCSGVDEPCPNAPVTPYPIVQVPQPVPAYPANNPCPISNCQTTCCVTQQASPCPPQPCCVTQQTSSCPPQPCQTTNNCVYPTNCLNQSGCNYGSTIPCYGSTTPCVGSTPPCVVPTPPCVVPTPPCVVPTTPCVVPTPPCVVPTTTPPNCQTPIPTTLPPPTLSPPTLPPPPNTTPPPGTITKCPSGTILIGRECHLLYCPRGSVMENGRCIVIECPDGTVWTGHRCSVPEPIVHDLKFTNTYITNINQTKPDIVLNNVNNIVVNASVTIHDESYKNNECNNQDYEDCEDDSATTPISSPTTATPPPPSPPSGTKCCTVQTPRICEQRNNRWQCFSRRSRKCGDFCVAPTIYLKPPRIYSRPHYLVMPPMRNDCQMSGTCPPIQDAYDCSGCAINYMPRCSPYCYRYTCPSHRCDFYDQQQYCDLNMGGSYGCQHRDGCFDDWCE